MSFEGIDKKVKPVSIGNDHAIYSKKTPKVQKPVTYPDGFVEHEVVKS